MLQDSLVLSSLPLLSSLLRKRVRREEAEEREEEARREEEELREEEEGRWEEEEAKPELRDEEEECLLSLQWGWMPAWVSSSLGKQ